MESISDDEKNYIIVQFMLTGFSPLVVRKIFDEEFHPECLKSSLSKEYRKIQQLKNRKIINQTQIDLLYPRGGIEPSSSTFDISLMLCLLRNFTDIDVHDKIPQPHDTRVAADLGRLHYYRNKCAHMNKGEISAEDFNLIWTDVTEAIQRLGGPEMYEKFQKWKQSIENSDQRVFSEILNEMQCSRRETAHLKEEIDRLKKEKKLEIDLLRVEHQEEAELQDSYFHKEEFKQDTHIKRKWREQLQQETFILSKTAISIFETIQHNQFVAISGMCGSGKSTLAHYIALRMSESRGYFVVPLSSATCERFLQLNDHRIPDTKILYILDDFVGNFSISDLDELKLASRLNEIKCVAARQITYKFLFTCGEHVNVMNKIKGVLPSIIECNLHSPELSLSLNERQQIFDSYVNDEHTVYQDNEFLMSKQLPLLCTLYRKDFCNRIQDFIMDSDQIITSKIGEMRETENPSYICLALLLVKGAFDLKYTLFECVKYGDYYTFLHDVISESSFKNTPKSRKVLQEGWNSIEGTYIKRKRNELLFIHDKIHDIVVSCIGKYFIRSILKYSKYSFIENRIRLESFETEETVKSATITHLTDSDVYALKSPLILSCTLGYDEFVSYLVRTWNRLLEYSKYEIGTPLYEACSKGHFNIVKILIESQKHQDVKEIPVFPISCACRKGYTDIVELLLKHSVYQDLSSGFVASCENGHRETVLLLLKKEPKLLEQDLRNGVSNALIEACKNGHEEVVQILLSHNMPVNNPESTDSTPLYYASMKGHLNIVTLLLKAKAQVNECDISEAEWNDHEEIVKCLRNHLSQ
ncbi:unnamed protein product [Mytilus coruscus]|uniref:Uncharacterized protein n=1 Tax=Mytilus coruscus TaxID=42192 RepID=A0A6J8AR32_MYTCO|nr:unnamed protein product [Mytilus coruscus]